MYKRPVPQELLGKVCRLKKQAKHLELMDRYVLLRLVEAGHEDGLVDERLIRAGYEITRKLPHSPTRATAA